MAQRKQLTWTELRVGLFVLIGLFVLAAGIFLVPMAGACAHDHHSILFAHNA